MTTSTAPLSTPGSLAFICGLVQDRSAIVLEPSKAYLVEARLTPIARQHGLASLDDLVTMIKRPGSTELQRQIVEAMTTNETSFYRDINPFEALKTKILPEMIQKRSNERALNIWSNACSSGQELYSIAMLIREHFPALTGWKLRLIGTDLSSKILSRAREGLFNQTEVNRGLPAALLLKYFKKEGLQWRITDEIRKMTEFCELNLVETWPTTIPKIDILFLRNVLIYFTPDTKKSILTKVRGILKPDGYMFLGGAETTMNLDLSFQRILIDKVACYQTGVAH